MASVHARHAYRPGEDPATGKPVRTVWRVLWRGPDGTQRQRTFIRKSDASSFAKTVDVDLARGQYVDPAAGRTTVADFTEQWLATRVWRRSTRDQADSHLRTHILPAFGTRTLASIRPTDIEGFRARLIREGLAPSTVEGVSRRLASILTAAARDRLIPFNPADGVTLKVKRAATTAEDRVAALSPDQLHALVDGLPGNLRAFALTQAYAGLRPSEAAGLTVDRLDLLRKTIRVDRQLITRQRGTEFGPPKTPDSVRVVPIAEQLVAVLSTHLATYGVGPDQLVFRSRRNLPLRRSSLGDDWHRAADRLTGTDLALPAAARGWHSLRHTFASAHLEAGTPITVVSRLLGHKTIAETSAVYAHMLTGFDDSRRNAAADVLSPPLGA